MISVVDAQSYDSENCFAKGLSHGDEMLEVLDIVAGKLLIEKEHQI
jgi:hypothetical protein